MKLQLHPLEFSPFPEFPSETLGLTPVEHLSPKALILTATYNLFCRYKQNMFRIMSCV